MTNRFPISDRSDGGDCLAVREKLDLTRPGEPDTSDIAEAMRHVESCPACQAVVCRHERWDAQLGAVCRDVPIPADLAVRLLVALETVALESAAVPQPASATVTEEVTLSPTTHHSPLTPPTSLLRRRRVIWFVAAAACTLIAGGSWYLASRPTIDLDTLISRASADGFAAELLPIFPEGTAPPPAVSMNGRIVFDLPRQLPEHKTAAERNVAVYFFDLPATRNGKSVHGTLLVIPVSRVIRPPGATTLAGSRAVYPGRNFCASTWVEGRFAYICLVKGGEDSLHRLHPARPVAI